ncbi:MAG: D-glycero-D-manno-heptose 1-phosphate kinase [Gammaproteobacteria bacterium]|nr:D-glycero-D-manno-heptose 1-phosphate kinase [Gammaproteobacteria bacterium]
MFIEERFSGNNKSAVRARAPLRLGLAGGGSDVSPYSDEYGGYVLNATIDKFAYATIIPNKENKIVLNAADRGIVWSCELTDCIQNAPKELQLLAGTYNRIIKDFCAGQALAVSVTTHSEAPPGSGLGSSSTMVVALVQAYAELLKLPLGEYEIAHLAYEIERRDLGLLGGKQDQYAAAFGGVNFMEFYANRVIVNPLRVKPWIVSELESQLLLFYTGVSRESAYIIDEQQQNMIKHDAGSIEALHLVKAEAVRMKEAILKGDFSMLASSMNTSWQAKKKMASKISNSSIDAIYDAVIRSGAYAGKVSGAGGGGFMMFLVDPNRKPQVIKTLSQFSGQIITCTLTHYGVQSWRVA